MGGSPLAGMSCIVGVTQNAHYDIFYPSPRGAKLHHYGRYDAINTKQYPSPRGAKLYHGAGMLNARRFG